LKKYGHLKVLYDIEKVMNYLPLVALIDNRVFCVHSGLSQQAKTLDQIMSLDRIHGD